MTAAELLELVDAVIVKRLNGDAYEQYSQAEQRFAGAPLSELRAMRRELKEEVSAGTNSFRLAEPFES